MRSGSWRTVIAGALLLGSFSAFLHLDRSAARGATDPLEVTIAGVPKVGGTLTATAAYTGAVVPEPATFVWQQCRVDLTTCTPLATTADVAPQLDLSGHFIATNAYALAPADAASRMRVSVSLPLTSVGPILSAPTDVVAPAVTPSPSPSPAPSRTVRRPAPRRLRPFPIVRIKGVLTGSGAYVTLLTVRAPRLARIVIRCSGQGCPRRRWARTVALVHARAFERRLLPAGVKLTISVTRRGYIGKHTRIVLRRGRPPWRRDRCLFPGSSRPRACPES